MCAERRLSGPGRQRGLSLIELLAFIVVVGVGLAGILSVLNITLRSSADPMLQKQALAIAESLLEEIQGRPLTWCDPDDANVATAAGYAGCATPQNLKGPAGEIRSGATDPFDNVGDYDGLRMSGIRDPADPLNVAAVIPGLENYSAAVAVTKVGADPAFGLTADDVLQITVSVWVPGQTVDFDQPARAALTLTGYRFRYAPNEH